MTVNPEIRRPWLLLGVEHLLALTIFGLLSLGLTWPLIRDPTWLTLGNGLVDIHLGTWTLWHYKEAVLGHQPLFYTYHLYYPVGIPTLVNGIGPVGAFFALPFWVWGPSAAFNGGVLVSMCLSGYCMYLLGRGLGFSPTVALVAGVMVQVNPIHLAGLLEHYEKTFIGLLPLTVLAAYRAFDLERRRGWGIVLGVVLALTALYSGYQLVYAGLGVGLLWLMRWFALPQPERPLLLRRGVWVALAIVVVLGPVVGAILSASSDPDLKQAHTVNWMANSYTPDIAQFVLPSFYEALVGPLLYPPATDPRGYPPSTIAWLNPAPYWVGASIETAVTLPLTGLALAAAALWMRDRRAWRWTLFTLVFIILALGPTLRVFGQTSFSVLKLPVLLPFAFFVTLPGLEFMRVSGRMMMMGGVGLAVVAGLGLTRLQSRFPRLHRPLVGLALVLLLVESWPKPWPQAPLPEPSPFYAQLGADPETYGILDLPLGNWMPYSGVYQMYQMTHRKPIAYGYVSNTYPRHPLPVIQRLAEYTPEKPPLVNARTELTQAGYRYVIYHHSLTVWPPPLTPDYSRQLIQQILGPTAKPVWEDRWLQVYDLR